ncbi:DUF362 domain-containing protein [candidate division CSSED10-310 bacterium]|uniref:DUF362 domain-containing protein n=1 Tax=candidate division CSSED10-310 bacterium TaxID=2855610 RepID=A0ABV6Z6T0_UNCC1
MKDRQTEESLNEERKPRKFFILWFVTGLCSLIWFLIRVIPKPGRLTYPCQRVAAPLASGFVLWLCGFIMSGLIFRKIQQIRTAPRTIVALACFTIIMAVSMGCPSDSDVEYNLNRGTMDQSDLRQCLGVAHGLMPGRVVWVREPAATDWDGEEDYWWQDVHTDPVIVHDMLNKAIKGYTDTSDLVEAWAKMFRHFNLKKGKGDVGYNSLQNEKIVIKANMVTCHFILDTVDPTTCQKTEYLNQIDASPQLIHALLWHLVHVVKVKQSNIAVGDTQIIFPNQWYDYLRADFPEVVYYDHEGHCGRTAALKSDDTFIHFSAPGGVAPEAIPTIFAQADYLINLAVLKGHGAGVTLCAKNHYGSLYRIPVEAGYYDLHLSLPSSRPGRGEYRANVDLMGCAHLGGKTILYLIDGLYGGYFAHATPYKWKMSPFNNDWPSSLFLSMDPVAIDSVAYDFLLAEWPDVVQGGSGSAGSLQGGAEDYLHEAALAHDPPSGTFYDPNGDNSGRQSLGVHEHWNNPDSKLYSRNLGKENGIELVAFERGVVRND